MAKKCRIGMCCCRCNLQKKIYKHPCNHKIGIGSIKKLFGYVCHAFLTQGENHLIFMDHKHSCGCECFEKKNKK